MFLIPEMQYITCFIHKLFIFVFQDFILEHMPQVLEIC